jgi:mutator protein MutT
MMASDLPKIKTTLLFLRKDRHILLAMKKRRFGAGKWNGVGGKIEPKETIEQAAIRECEEEIGVTPQNLHRVGEFHFVDLPDVEHYCYIFETYDWKGEPVETEEMRPKWFRNEDIPYDTMWPDDIYWIPKMLDGIPFIGKVIVEADKVRECTINEVKSLAPSDKIRGNALQ